MTEPSSGITFRSIQEAMPAYHIAGARLDGLLSAIPPPPAGASAAWCRERLALVVDEIAARVPAAVPGGAARHRCGSGPSAERRRGSKWAIRATTL
jgi:hypothetical protein